MANCPNKSSKEWVHLVDKLGNDNAWAWYVKLGDYVPTIQETNAIAKGFDITETNNHNVWDIENNNDLVSWKGNKKIYNRFTYKGAKSKADQLKGKYPIANFKLIPVYTNDVKNHRLQTIVDWHHEEINRTLRVINQDPTKVNFTLKVINALLKISSNRQTIKLNSKQNPYIEKNLRKALYGQQVPKEQVDFIFNYMRDNNIKSINTDELALELASNYAYNVEINIAKKDIIDYNDPDSYYELGATPSEEREQLIKNTGITPTQYYSNLTVSGGTNYTENEIRTPDIIPNIKGHAQFSTDQGIGWFRSDDKKSQKLEPNREIRVGNLRYSFDKTDVFSPYKRFETDGTYTEITEEEFYKAINVATDNAKTRRILEIQSDLFQKGRDKKDLVKGLELVEYKERVYEYQADLEGGKVQLGYIGGDLYDGPVVNKSEIKELELQKNKFLQLLNKDSNWVTFFIKSIIQDSAKKGYEKVLFPKGETAAKIEGHETIADDIKKIDNELAKLKTESYYDLSKLEREANIRKTNELEQRKSELKSQGIEKLKPIEAFYEIKVGNILKKNFTTKTITDEYGNQWYEVEITPEVQKKVETIQLQLQKEGKGDKFGLDRMYELGFEKGMAFVDAKTLLTNLSKNNSLPSELKSLVPHLLEVIDRNNVNIYPSTFTGDKAGIFMGYSVDNNVIYVNLTNDRQINEENFDTALVHEIMHAVTSNTISRVQRNGAYNTKEDTFVKTLSRLRLNLKQLYYKKYGKQTVDSALDRLNSNKFDDADAKFYGLLNEHEFVAELLTNKDFLNEVQELESTNKRNLIQRFIDAIRRLLGIPTSASNSVQYILDFTKQFEFSKINGTDQIAKTTINPFSEEELIRNKERRVNAALAAQSKVEKIDELKRQSLELLQRKLKRFKNVGKPDYAEKVENLIIKINKLDSLTGVLYFVKDSSKRINGLYKRYIELEKEQAESDENLFDTKTLALWKDSVIGYEMLEDIRILLNKENWQKLIDEKVATYSDLKGVLDNIDRTIANKNELINLYKEKGEGNLTTFLAQHSTLVEAEYKKQLEIEYNKLPANEKAKTSLDKYIEEHLDTHAATLRERTELMLRRELKKASKDVGLATRWSDNILDSPDMVVATMAKAFALQDMKARKETKKVERELVDLVRDLEDKYGNTITTNPYDFYKWFLETDDEGNPTGHYITKYKSKLMEEYHRLTNDIKQFDSDQRKAIRKYWLNTNAPLDYTAFQAAKEEKIKELANNGMLTMDEANLLFQIDADPWAERKPLNETVNEKAADELNDWIYRNIWDYRNPSRNGLLYEKITDKGDIKWGKSINWNNSKWDAFEQFMEQHPEDPKTKFYKYIDNIRKTADKRLPWHNRLGSRLPGIIKDTSERIKDKQKPSEVFRGALAKNLNVLADETERGTLELTNEAGNPVSFLPIYYTNKVDVKDQSFDVATLYHRYFGMASDFVHKSQILPEMEMARFFVENRKVTKNTSKGVPIIGTAFRNQSNESTIDGEKSNVYHQLNDWFESIVYGKKTKDEGEWNIFGLKVDQAKALDALQRYTSLNLLGLNFVQGTANVMLGEAMQRIETVAKEFVSGKSYKKARHVYDKNLGGIMGDIGNRKPTNLISLLLEEFDVLNEYEGNKFRKNSKFRQLMQTNTLFFTSHAGEHFVQSRFLLAMLEELRAKDKDGNDIGSMLDMIKVKDGELDVDERVANFSEKERLLFEYKVKGVLSRLHGEYSDLGRIALQRFSLGRMVYQFRKFIVPGFKRRWGKYNYNERLEDFTEGNYRVTARYFTALLKDLRKMEFGVIKHWEELTKAEKANVHRTLAEVGFLISAWILGNVFVSLHADIDDEDEWLWEFAAYQMLRFKSELLFFTPKLDEPMKILRSPAASMSFFENTIKLVDQLLTNPIELYEKGPWKGKPKMQKIVTDFIPAYKQYYRLRDIQQNINWFK